MNFTCNVKVLLKASKCIWYRCPFLLRIQKRKQKQGYILNACRQLTSHLSNSLCTYVLERGTQHFQFKFFRCLIA